MRGFFALGAGTVALALMVTLAGCTEPAPTPVTTSTSSPQSASPSATDIPVGGTALPAGYRIDPGRSLVLGGGDTWTGRLAYTAAGTADEVFDFLRREMPNFGWAEVSAVRADVNLLTFVSEATNRVATLQIERSTVLGSTKVEMVVAPGTMPAAAPPRPAPPARPRVPAPTPKPPA